MRGPETRRSLQERETQMYMQSPAARSSSSSRVSRWSGSPARTVVSQVPQMPCRHEERTSTPADPTASSTVSPGFTVTVVPVRASSTSKGAFRTGALRSSATKRSVRSADGGQSAQVASMAARSGPGPQQ